MEVERYLGEMVDKGTQYLKRLVVVSLSYLRYKIVSSDSPRLLRILMLTFPSNDVQRQN